MGVGAVLTKGIATRIIIRLPWVFECDYEDH